MPGGQWPAGRRYPLPVSHEAPQPRPATRQQLPAFVLVVDCPQIEGTHKGLLLKWTKGDKGWLGRVFVAVQGVDGDVEMTLWVAAEHLRPAAE